MLSPDRARRRWERGRARALGSDLLLVFMAVILLNVIGCTIRGAEGGPTVATPEADGPKPSSVTVQPPAEPSHQFPARSTAVPSPTFAPAPTITATRIPTPAPANLPVGFPVDRGLRPWQVIEGTQGPELTPPDPGGPTAVEVARDYQTRLENDMEANRYGWNCRLHARYEGAPAVDWYLPEGTPVYATMDGQAELAIITTVNSFEYYGVDTRLFLGLPSPQLPRYLFPGPSGGMGVFTSILNGNLRADFGHVNLNMTLGLVPDDAFLSPYTRSYPYEKAFARPLNAGDEIVVARWPIKKGQTIAFVGNNGYSDVSHLHYQVVTQDRKTKYCPTDEPLPSSGWLFRRPAGFP